MHAQCQYSLLRLSVACFPGTLDYDQAHMEESGYLYSVCVCLTLLRNMIQNDGLKGGIYLQYIAIT